MGERQWRNWGLCVPRIPILTPGLVRSFLIGCIFVPGQWTAQPRPPQPTPSSGPTLQGKGMGEAVVMSPLLPRLVVWILEGSCGLLWGWDQRNFMKAASHQVNQVT